MTKKILKSVGLIAFAIAVAIGSFFVPISKRNTSHLASADTTLTNSKTFKSSDIFFSRFANNTSFGNFSFSDLLASSNHTLEDKPFWVLNWEFTIDLTFEGNRIDVSTINMSMFGYIYQNLSKTDAFGTLNSDRVLTPVSFDNVYHTYDSSSHIPTISSCRVGYVNLSSDIISNSLLAVSVYSPGNSLPPTLDMVTIEIGNYYNFPTYNGVLDNRISNCNIVCYTDTNGYRYYFYVPVWYTYEQMPMSYLDYRIYYTGINDLSDSQLYHQGYNEGLMANQQNIYENGYTTGYDDGLDNGKIIGAAEANDYSFFSLFGAIFDAPVTLFTSLLNFEFLGINLWSFITSLLTLSIILFVIKLFIRR